MKFIRDIIAEKKNTFDAGRQSAHEGELTAPATPGTAGNPGEDLDLVHKVASGGTSLGRAGHFNAFVDDDPSDVGDHREKAGDADLSGESSDYDDEFDLFCDTQDTDHMVNDRMDAKTAQHEPAELFADIWNEDQNGQEEQAGDIFDSGEVGAEQTSNVMPEPDSSETNATALMRTMYPQKSTVSRNPLPDPRPTPDSFDASPDLTGERAEPARQEDNASPFQKILRRQEAMPPAPGFDPTPEPEPLPTPDSVNLAEQSSVAPVRVPAPAAGRARRQAGRVKTRLLGFGNDFGSAQDPFAAKGMAETDAQTMYPVGWMVVISGPGRGNAFTLFNGVSQIGRGEDQAVRLDFGDSSISRSNHAVIAYDPEQKGFFLGHGGKANLVRLNGTPVLSTEPLHSGATIRIGETTLRFIGLCGAEFDWGNTQDEESDNARHG